MESHDFLLVTKSNL